MTRHRYRLPLIVFTLLVLVSGVASAQDPPPPQKVFQYTTRADAERVYLDFSILKGFYLYRARFGFESGTDGIVIGAASFPRGETHKDEYFGEQEIYRGKFAIAIPYKRTGAHDSLDLQLKLQGCKDDSICYLPQDWTAAIELPPATAGARVRPSLFDTGRGTVASSATDDLLPVEQAFVMNARFDKPNELTIAWQIAPGYYLYRDKLTATASGKIDLGAVNLPAGQPHKDDNFGDVQIFRDFVEAKVPLARASPDAIDVVIAAGFQGCKDNSICYPPGEQTMPMVLPATSEFPAAANQSPGAVVSEQDQWLSRIVNGSWWTLLGSFYIGGLLLAFTPCVLPMVPILSSIIAGQGAVTARKGFLLSLSYVLGMAATYTSAGAVTALAGSQVQAAFQAPWLIATFSALFVVLALSMFGLFELQMPTAIQTRLANLANRQQGGTFVGTAIMGALTSLIVTTCVAPPLIAALTAIAQTGDVRRGAGALFAMSIGMGSPLLVVGASAGQLLPRVGPWMNVVKAAFGVMMLGMAIWMMQRVLPGSVTLVLWSLLVFLTGVFLGAFDALPTSPSPARRLAKGLGVLACLYGALMLIGATLGGDDPLRPIPQAAVARAGTGGAVAAAKPALEFRAIETVAALDQALTQAREAHQPVMLDFTAEWCISCKEMEHNTFPDQGVIGALKPFMLLRADVTANDKDDQALLQRFHSFGPPTIAFFDAGGTERENFKLVGFVPPADFTKHVTNLASL